MKLYHTPGASSLAPHIALREAGISDFNLIRVDIFTGQLGDGSNYRAIHPRGAVPLLELDDGQRLSENSAILQYIADALAPDSGLAPPAGTLARARMQEWLGFVNSELHPLFAQLFDPQLDATARQALTDWLTTKLDLAEARLNEQPFVVGERFTVADVYLFVIFGWTHMVGLDPMRWPMLTAHRQRVGARPAVLAALSTEGLEPAH